MILKSIYWDCPDNWFQRLSINWNWQNDWCLVLSISWNCPGNDFGNCLSIGIVLKIVFTGCPLIGVAWAIDVWCFQIIGIVQTNDVGDCLLIGIILKIVFTGCLLIGIAWTIDVWCFQLIGIVQTNDLGDCLLIGIVLKIVFTACLLIEISWTIDFGWCTWIDSVGTTVETTAFRDRPLIGIIRTIEFWKALLFENRQLLLCRVQLIDLISTLQYHAIIASLTGWTSSLYTQPFARYILMHYALVWIVSI